MVHLILRKFKSTHYGDKIEGNEVFILPHSITTTLKLQRLSLGKPFFNTVMGNT